jgi:WD40 repeat protein
LIWDQKNAHKDYILCVEWSPNGKLIATGSELGIIRIWNASSGELFYHLNDPSLKSELAHDGPVVALSWSLNGSTLASVSGEDVDLKNGDNWVKLWNVASVKKIVNLTQFQFHAMDAAFSPRSHELLGLAGDEEIRIYNITSHKIVQQFNVSGAAHSISWSPNGTYIAVGTRNFTVEIFNFDSNKKIGLYNDPEFKRREIAWSPSGKFIAETGSSDIIKIRAVVNGTVIHSLYGPARSEYMPSSSRCEGDFLPSLSWSSNGRYIAAASAGLSGVTVFGDKIYDRIPPRLVGFSPTGTSTQRSANFLLKFSEPVPDNNFVEAFSYTDGITTWTAEDGKLTKLGREFIFAPYKRFDYNTSIYVTIDTSLTDYTGNSLSGKNFWTFRTVENNAPILSNSRVDPSRGDDKTTFEFLIKYLDLNNEKPVEIHVIIDNIPYTMSYLNGSSYNGYYQYSTRLKAGTHSYYFRASDGYADSTGTVGPEHSVLLEVQSSESDEGLLALRADLIGAIIVIILIITWFKLVAGKREKKD